MDIRRIQSTGDHTSCTNGRKAAVYEENSCCFWERLTNKVEIFILGLGERKAISVVDVT